MKVFIGKIPSNVGEKQVEDYFSQFGKVKNMSVKGTYGFLSFENDDSIDAVLSQRPHVIGGSVVSVERAKNGKRGLEGGYYDRYMDRERGGYGSPPREYRGYDRRYAPRSPGRYVSRSPGRYEPGYSDRYGVRNSPDGYRDEGFRYGDMRKDMEYCDYCSGCPVHGNRDAAFESRKRHQVRDHPNNHLKVVFEGIPVGTTVEEFKNFVRSYGFEPSFSRIGYRGTHAILEFRTTEDKDNAMKKIDGVCFNGSVLRTRSYLSKDEYKNRERDIIHGRNEFAEDDIRNIHGSTDTHEVEETRAEN